MILILTFSGTDNFIDGMALVSLPEDFDEFNCLVPQVYDGPVMCKVI